MALLSEKKNGKLGDSRNHQQAVIEYYERHKTGFASKADAAYKIFEKKIVPFKYSTIYTWLDKHIRSTKK